MVVSCNYTIVIMVWSRWSSKVWAWVVTSQLSSQIRGTEHATQQRSRLCRFSNPVIMRYFTLMFYVVFTCFYIFTPLITLNHSPPNPPSLQAVYQPSVPWPQRKPRPEAAWQPLGRPQFGIANLFQKRGLNGTYVTWCRWKLWCMMGFIDAYGGNNYSNYS